MVGVWWLILRQMSTNQGRGVLTRGLDKRFIFLSQMRDKVVVRMYPEGGCDILSKQEFSVGKRRHGIVHLQLSGSRWIVHVVPFNWSAVGVIRHPQRHFRHRAWRCSSSIRFQLLARAFSLSAANPWPTTMRLIDISTLDLVFRVCR
jgi:hypothetical protein